MSILKLDHVVKRFGDFTAVNDLTFSVPEGGIFGFLGGNGAGKTTSLRMALDIIRPTSGSIEILGRKPGRENAAEIARRVGRPVVVTHASARDIHKERPIALDGITLVADAMSIARATRRAPRAARGCRSRTRRAIR